MDDEFRPYSTTQARGRRGLCCPCDRSVRIPDSGLKAIWACWDRPVLGATLAVEAAGRLDVKTYGVDGSPEYVELVARPGSPAAAVAAQQPYKIGRSAALNVARYLSGQPVPPVTFVSAVMITKANAGEVAEPFLPR